MKNITSLFILLVFVSACSTKLSPGTYTTSSSDRVLFAGTTIEVLSDNKINILHWTDTGNRYGEGTYTLKGNTLDIVFDSVDIVMAHYTEKSIDRSYADAITYQINSKQKLVGASVSVYDNQMGFMKGGVVGYDNICKMHIPNDIKSAYIIIDVFGYESLKIPIKSQHSTAYTIYLMETFTEFFKEGERKSYQIKQKGDEFILKEGKQKIFLKEKSN